MKCFICSQKTHVTNSRGADQDPFVWRRRACEAGHVFTTYESPNYASMQVAKSDGRVETFNRDKLFMSLWQSLHSLEAGSEITKTVITLLLKEQKEKITSKDIYILAHATLLRFHPKAAQRYAAYADQ